MNHRKLNFLFVFVSLTLFVLESGIDDRFHLLWAFVLAGSIAFLAFILNLLTLDGARAAVMLGLIAYGFGGFESAFILVSFFLTSNLVGLFYVKDNENPLRSITDRRNGTQVWSNAFWFAIFVCMWYVLKADFMFVAAIGAIATACADTWSTEFGTRKSGKTVLITSREEVKPGTDGGISIFGTFAALIGALFIASLTLLFDKNYPGVTFLAIALGGFLGAMVDSLLGAIFQTGDKRLPNFLDASSDEDNNSVNFLATGIGAIITIIIYNLVIYVMV